MGKPAHMKELGNGVQSWNKWREQQPDVTPDLSGQDLKGWDLAGFNLRDANLSEAKLKGANLSGADLGNTVIAGTKLMEAKLWADDDGSPEWGTATEETIRSVCDLMRACKKLDCSNGSDKVFYFRGVKSASYKLEPSLARALSPSGRGNLMAREGEMLLDLMSRRPEDFLDRTTALEQWGLARHHWLPTRLLDVTKNPLVALYGACLDVDHKIDICGACKEKLCHPCQNQTLCDSCRQKVCAEELCKEGVVHVFAVPREMIKTFASDTVRVIANFAKLPQRKQRLILGEKVGNVDDYYRARGDLYHHIRGERPNFQELVDPRDLFQVFVVEPRESFERVRAQSGAFLISASHSSCKAENSRGNAGTECEANNESGCTTMEFEPESIEKRVGPRNRGMAMYGHYTFRVVSSKKGAIRKELELLNVTQETLYPGLDNAAKGAQERAEKRV